MPPTIEEVLRTNAPQVLGALTRRYGRFDEAEDAVQEALLAASQRWPTGGIPEDPRAWLATVASRRLVDRWRSESARRRREERVAVLDDVGPAQTSGRDDTLSLVFLCCHPALSAASQIALTLRAVGGLTTAEVANAFLVPEATMAQRISRAKKTIATAGATFSMPSPEERADRLRAVMHVLYLVFNEGYTASAGESLRRGDLTAEAIRLARLLRELAPDEPEVSGLLALMLLTDARRDARTDEHGLPVALPDQDRGRWDRDGIAEGVAVVTEVLRRGTVGASQLQAAIAAIHAEAPSAEATDWREILALYDVLEQVAASPVVTLNRAVALANVEGPRAGLALLDPLAEALGDSHRLHAVRAHLLERAGDLDGALESYRRAARMTASVPEQRYLALRAARLSSAPG